MFSIRLSNKAEKQYRELEPEMALRVDGLFKALEEKPVPATEFKLKKLAGTENEYRVRLSSHRVLYQVYWQEQVIRVSKIERKSDHTYKR